MPKVIVVCTIGELGEFERSIMVVSCLFRISASMAKLIASDPLAGDDRSADREAA
jgi:hypothetical protein